MSAGLVPSEASVFDLQVATSSLCPYKVLTLCVHIPGVSVCAQISFYEDTSPTGLQPTQPH